MDHDFWGSPFPQLTQLSLADDLNVGFPITQGPKSETGNGQQVRFLLHRSGWYKVASPKLCLLMFVGLQPLLTSMSTYEDHARAAPYLEMFEGHSVVNA